MKKNLLKSLTNTFSKFFIQEQGAVAIITGLLFLVFIGFAALAIDASLWYSEKRKLQLAADAGAAGGAIALQVTGASTYKNYANADLVTNGCTAANNCTVVAINNPPTSGPSAGNTGAVEVILSKPADVFLAGLFLSSGPTLNARSVAGNKPTNTCIVALANKGVGIKVAGNATINSPNCGVYANSSDSKAITTNGGGSINATGASVSSHGGFFGSGTITGTQVSNAPVLADPYGGVTMPTPGACTAPLTNYTLNNTSATISPGTYCGGITLKNSSSLTMNPGLYFLVQSGSSPSSAGNFIADSQSSVTANGVTIVMTTIAGTGSTNYGSVQIPSHTQPSSTITMSPMTTGSTKGILFFGDRNSSGLTEQFTGGGNQTLSGVLYFPTNDVNYSGQSGASGNPCFQIVSSTITFTGGATLGNGCASAGLGTTNLLE